MIRRDYLLYALGALAVVVLAWGIWSLFPGPHLEHRFHALIGAVGDRDWKKVRGFMAADYRDKWGNHPDEAVTRAGEVLQNFLTLEVTPEDVKIQRDGRTATVSSRLHLDGRGNAIGEAVKDYTNRLQADFQFAWERKSWEPWDWQLVSVSQPEIDSLEMP